MDTEILITLSCRYPQLLLPSYPGVSKSEAYRDAVLRGRPVSGEPCIQGSPDDRFSAFETPEGSVEALFLSDRGDFERCWQALACRCEPEPVPPSVGASIIRGLINWEKIRSHRTAYLLNGGTDWSAELRRFTAEKKNYLDTIILLSGGPYSNLPARSVGMAEQEWIEKSICIRTYHELTHFVCRSRWPEDVDPIRDEVVADAVGLMAAFGRYDAGLAKLFLGIESETYRPGARLETYLKTESVEEARACAEAWIIHITETTEQFTGEIPTERLFDRISALMRKEDEE